MNGILLIDKPAGMSSMNLLSKVKKVLRSQIDQKVKVGHCGTLDPLASGLMVVLVGKATKLQDQFLTGDKTYSGTIKLGLKTNTDDIMGVPVLENDLSKLFEFRTKENILSEIIEKFSGSQLQLPPIYSALHVDGKRSYDLARNGQTPELKPRKVLIEFLDLRFHSYSTIRFEIKCSKGTYVRALARDIGDYFGCGACIQSLRRLASSPFNIEQAQRVEEIVEQGFVEPRSIDAERHENSTELVGNLLY